LKGPEPQVQVTLVRQEAAEIQNKQAVELVESAAQDIDSLLQNAAKEAIKPCQNLWYSRELFRHSYHFQIPA
jgi:hypothetical protein